MENFQHYKNLTCLTKTVEKRIQFAKKAVFFFVFLKARNLTCGLIRTFCFRHCMSEK